MSTLIDIFSDDAFGMVSLTQGINNVDSVPGMAGAYAFAGTGKGIATTDVVIESRDWSLDVIPTSPRGGPAPQEVRPKATAFKLSIPQVKLEETIQASAIQNVRQFGGVDLASVQTVVNEQLQKIASRMDLTLEHMRLGALRGVITDADGTVLTDLFSEFGVTQTTATFSASSNTLRESCQTLKRYLLRNVKRVVPKTAKIVALCGQTFFNSIIDHADCRTIYQNWQGAQQALGGNFAGAEFTFADVTFVDYLGTDDVVTENESSGSIISGGKVAVPHDQAVIFLSGVPGLFQEYYAPADFLDTVNEIGLPRYARVAVDQELSRYVKLHSQTNPLPICTRPQTLVKGTF